MKLRIILTALILCSIFANDANSTPAGPFEFSGTITSVNGDLTKFPGNFGFGSTFYGTITYDDTALDINSDNQVGLYILSGSSDYSAVTISDLDGNTFIFEAETPSVLIYDDYSGISRVDFGSDHFSAYGGNYLFQLSFNDFSGSIISSDKLSDLNLASPWDQIYFELTTNRGFGDAGIAGYASLQPQPDPEPTPVEELVLYDKFKGKFIDPNKWEPSGTAEKNSLDLVREVRKNYLRMLSRIYAGNRSSVRVKFPFPEEVTAIMIKGKVKDLELIDCQGSERIRALRASGFFYNTIRDGGIGPDNAIGDVLAAIHVERSGDSSDPPGVLRVIPSVSKCLDRNCDGIETLPGLPQDLGEYKVGERISLLIQWDEALNRFIFQRDNEPEIICEYSDYPDFVNKGAPGLPQKRLGISHKVAPCDGDPQPEAFVETRIYKVFVNESAVP